MLYSVVVSLLLPTLAYCITCHRCFGDSFCHDPEHEDFSSTVATATCGSSSSSYWTEFGGDDPLSLQVENALNAYYEKTFHNVSTTTTQTNYYCLTARVDEPHNNYTYRTCVSYYIDTAAVNPTLCELIDTIISTQNRYNGSLSCRACDSDDYCNNHLLSAGDGLSDISDTTQSTTTESIQSTTKTAGDGSSDISDTTQSTTTESIQSTTETVQLLPQSL